MRIFTFTGLFLTLLLVHSCDIDPPDTELNNYAPCCTDDPFVGTVGAGKLYIPNMITANFDGINDYFYPLVGPKIGKVENFEIRSAGGQLLFSRESLNLNEATHGWNAAISSTEVYRGLFRYRMEVSDIFDVKETLEGTACAFACDASPDKIGNVDNCFYPVQHDGEGGLDPDLPNFEEDCL